MSTASPDQQDLFTENFCSEVWNYCSCNGLYDAWCFSGLCHSFAYQSCAIFSPFLSFLLTAWLLLTPQPASLPQSFRPSQLKSVVRRVVHLSQLAFRYLSEACWFRHGCKWLEQVIEIFSPPHRVFYFRLYRCVHAPPASFSFHVADCTLLTNTLESYYTHTTFTS